MHGYHKQPLRKNDKNEPNLTVNLHGMARFLAGFWVDRAALKHIGDMYRCSRLTCLGSKGDATFVGTVPADDTATGASGGARRGLLQKSKKSDPAEAGIPCWQRDAYVDGTAAFAQCFGDATADGLQCEEGSGGPLCGACLSRYTYSSTKRKCQVRHSHAHSSTKRKCKARRNYQEQPSRWMRERSGIVPLYVMAWLLLPKPNPLPCPMVLVPQACATSKREMVLAFGAMAVAAAVVGLYHSGKLALPALLQKSWVGAALSGGLLCLWGTNGEGM